MREIITGVPPFCSFYRHFKDHWYVVLYVAKDAMSGEQVVVYQAAYDNHEVFVRPLEDFMAKVGDRSIQEYRFMHLSELGLDLSAVHFH